MDSGSSLEDHLERIEDDVIYVEKGTMCSRDGSRRLHRMIHLHVETGEGVSVEQFWHSDLKATRAGSRLLRRTLYPDSKARKHVDHLSVSVQTNTPSVVHTGHQVGLSCQEEDMEDDPFIEEISEGNANVDSGSPAESHSLNPIPPSDFVSTSPLKLHVKPCLDLPIPESSRKRVKKAATLPVDVLQRNVLGFECIMRDTHRPDVHHCARLYFSVLCGYDEKTLGSLRLDIGEVVEMSSVQVFADWMRSWNASFVTKEKKWELMVALAESVVKTEKAKQFPFRKPIYTDKIDLAIRSFRKFAREMRPMAQVEAGRRVSLEHARSVGRFLSRSDFVQLLKSSEELLNREIDFLKGAERSLNDWYDFQKVLIFSMTVGIPVQRRQVLENATTENLKLSKFPDGELYCLRIFVEKSSHTQRSLRQHRIGRSIAFHPTLTDGISLWLDHGRGKFLASTDSLTNAVFLSKSGEAMQGALLSKIVGQVSVRLCGRTLTHGDFRKMRVTYFCDAFNDSRISAEERSKAFQEFAWAEGHTVETMEGMYRLRSEVEDSRRAREVHAFAHVALLDPEEALSRMIENRRADTRHPEVALSSTAKIKIRRGRRRRVLSDSESSESDE
eukprot:TRINITY_DN1158_c0_g1_i1.p1 TRINITY_DN1158_c0_g1~~TRINITY_DN1158_c0_g1_i1.p1  ORF type:complete len:615 (+),score=122.10 TRINITY_DN1158_c0_g1_i1:190-2034(+)